MTAGRSGRVPAWMQVRLVRWAWRIRAAQGSLTGLALAAQAGRVPSGPLPEPPRRILVVRLDEIGDALLGLPMLRALRRRWPRAELRVLCKPSVAPLYALVPAVDAAVSYLPMKTRNLGALAAWTAARRFAPRALEPWKPDLCINPRWGFDLSGSAWLALYSGAPSRVAWSEKGSPLKARLNAGFDRAYTRVLAPTKAMHQVEQGLAMARDLGATERVSDRERVPLKLPAEARAWARASLPGGRWLALAPGAGHPKKRWPLERFALVARHAAQNWGFKLVLLGSAAERADATELLALARVGGRNLCGEAGLAGAFAVLGRCAALVGNDSAPAHMAAAVGVPSVVLSSFARASDAGADNAPARFRPWGVPSQLLQPEFQRRPCRGECEAYGAHCILDIEAAAAVSALGSLVGHRD